MHRISLTQSGRFHLVMKICGLFLRRISCTGTALVALLKCVVNALSPYLWYTVLGFVLFSSCTLGILYAIQYIGGGIGLTVKKIIDFLNKVRHFFRHDAHDWDVEAIDAMAALVDGTCEPFAHPSGAIKYLANKFFSLTMCEKIAWYESITLTRIFIARPMRTVFVDESMMPLHSCRMTKVSDMCAWVVGFESFLKYMLKKGLWLLVLLHIFSPLLSLCLSRLGKCTARVVHRIGSRARAFRMKISAHKCHPAGPARTTASSRRRAVSGEGGGGSRT